MNDLVGIIRTREELEKSLGEIEKLKERAKHLAVAGDRRYNPGWHLAIDLRNMLLVSECIAKAALEREESRGGHTRDDYPGFDDRWGTLEHRALDQRRGRRRRPRHPAAAGDARRAGRVLRGRALIRHGVHAEDEALARRPVRRRPAGLRRRGRDRRGRPRRHPPRPGHPGRRPRRPVELQGRQVRLVQRRDQRPPAADVHEPAVRLRRRPRRSRSRRCAPSR